MRDAASIAIVTPVRNGMPWLAETIASIRAQNYAPLEIVIVDDGSTDDTRDYVRGLMRESNRVRLLEYTGIGPSAARNAGIRATSSPFLLFLDADDLLPEGALAALADALVTNPDAGFAQGLIRNFRNTNGANLFFTVPYRYLNLGANLWRRELFDRVGLFDEELRLCEDMDLLMRCWEQDVRKAEVDCVALYYRRHAQNMTRGLAGSGFGLAKAYKKRIDRIRSGVYDASTPRHIDQATYLGAGPAEQDEVYYGSAGRSHA